MNVTINQELEQYVQDKIGSGKYQTPSDVIHDALRLFQKHDQLRQDIAVGVEQADRGESKPLDVDAIKARGRELLAQRNS
ncbi:MAG: type II toxin-antitoxin system ParD family antitoxin [Planctomycetota bacterium]|nr:type II toxin-antitoxin system ParD family antitoxin [Planctomycetota bacterium]